mmetsp:Transcript_56677/g.157774  ORF Transcript_56677/g.157774 Transcript_56677/m.157774 type:complete len:432 (+) Transcript_56677:141-1436(+)
MLSSASAAAATSNTAASSAATWSPAWLASEARLRPSVSARKAVSFCHTAPMRSEQAANSSSAGLEAAAPSVLTSIDLLAMNPRASPIARWTAPAACSEAWIAMSASSFGNTSTPLRKGSSASLTFSSAASAASTMARACCARRPQSPRSRCSLVDALTWRSFSPADFPRNISLASAAFSGEIAPAFASSKDWIAALSSASASMTAAPIRSTASSDGCSSPSGVARVSAMATFSSTPFIFSSCWSSTVLAAFSPCPSTAAFRSFESCTWALLSRCSSCDTAETIAASRAEACFSLRIVLACWYASLASFSATAACPQADSRLSTEAASKLSGKSFTTSASVCTCASASPTFSAASCSTAAVFRLDASFLKSASCLATASARTCSSSSSVFIRSRTTLENRAWMPSRFALMNARAWSAAASARLATASHSLAT